MRFYSRITKQPESVITEIRDGFKIVNRKKICQFVNGICDTEDSEVIEKLEAHPDRFRTDHPWPSNDWRDTEEGKKLLKKGEALNIDIRHIRKEYLLKLIAEKEAEESGIKPEKPQPKSEIPFHEVLSKAKSLDIKTHRRKKEDILKDIETKEVIIHA